MRIAFVQSSREPFHAAGSRVRLGSAEGNDLVLTGTGLAPGHLAIVEDRRGLVMEVLPGAPHVYVNARPVRERALLRFGDQLNVGGHKLLLLPDGDGTDDAAHLRETAAESVQPGLAALRLVSGMFSGRLLAIDGKLTLGGKDSPLPGVAHACVLWMQGGRLLLDARDSGVLVNGIPRRRARLTCGDQLTLGEHRFVVEAPDLPDTLVEQPVQLQPVATPRQPSPASKVELGWLLGTAALLAAAIALLLWWRH